MTTISRQTTVPYSCRQMYDLVSDVAAYSQFVPACAESVVEARDSADAGEGKQIRATLRFQYKGMSLGFTTINLNTPSRSIKMKLSEGPFRYLEGTWSFVPSGDAGCNVELRLDFGFSNRIYAEMFKLGFNRLALSLFDAFVDRAHTVYGRQ